MRLILRLLLFVALLLFALPCVYKVAALVMACCGEVLATVVLAFLLAFLGFLFEYLFAGRPGWFLFAVFPVVVIVRYVLWNFASYFANIGPIGFPGLGPNSLGEVCINTFSFVFALFIVNSVKRRFCFVRTSLRSLPEEVGKSSGRVAKEEEK